jgi:hypothetical protein
MSDSPALHAAVERGEPVIACEHVALGSCGSPIVDLSASREAALDAYQAMRQAR